MAQLSKIISEINISLATSLNIRKLGDTECFGLSELIEDTEKRTTPIIIVLSGDGRYVGYDDVDSLRLYHRLIGSQYVKGKEGYGSSNGISQIATLLIVVAFKINRIRFTSDDVEALIVSAMPSSISNQLKSDLGLKSCGVFITGSYHDTPAIFAREYKGHQYSPDTNMRMFELRYQVECTWGQSCINSICCI